MASRWEHYIINWRETQCKHAFALVRENGATFRPRTTEWQFHPSTGWGSLLAAGWGWSVEGAWRAPSAAPSRWALGSRGCLHPAWECKTSGHTPPSSSWWNVERTGEVCGVSNVFFTAVYVHVLLISVFINIAFLTWLFVTLCCIKEGLLNGKGLGYFIPGMEKENDKKTKTGHVSALTCWSKH